ncbi:NucA/NucB deoxyribonuclease domain-containing protein [Actinomadura sp. 1N219]
MNMLDVQWIDYTWNRTNWNHDAVIQGTNATGDLADGIDVSVASSCHILLGFCGVTQESVPPGTVLAIKNDSIVLLNWQEELTAPLRQGYENAVELDGLLGMLITWFPNAPHRPIVVVDNGSYNTEGENLTGRCDNNDGPVRRNRGCVNQHFITTLTYDEREYPAVGPVAEHIYDRQVDVSKGGHPLPSRWGVPAYGNFLNRTQDEDVEADNRRVACQNVPPSCDEWPLATTYQGAAQVPPNDWSARTVPDSANSSQGAITGAFYRTERMLDGDAFWVRVILKDGRASW